MKRRNPDSVKWEDLSAEDRRQLTYLDKSLDKVFQKEKGKKGLQLAERMKELEPGDSFFIERSEWTSKKQGPGGRVRTIAAKWNQSFWIDRNGKQGWTVTRLR